MQSRTFIVPGVGGRERPFFVGEWTDAMGVKHRKGMADLLLQPRVSLVAEVSPGKSFPHVKIPVSFTIPLWVECKAGEGKMDEHQLAFRLWVLSIGAAHICVTENCEELMKWFEEKKVRKS
jgi:hypothetical protein